MNRRGLGLGALAAVLAAAAAWFALAARAPAETVETPLLVPDLASNVESIDEIRISGAGKSLVTLQREGQGFVVLERERYPADAGRLRELVNQVATTRLSEQKTSRPASYAQLGVEDPEQPGSDSIRLQIKASERDLADFIVGRQRSRGEGTFVRRMNDAESWLTIDTLRVSRAPGDWIDNLLVDLPPTVVRTILVSPAEGPAFRIVATAANADEFALEKMPPGRKLQSQFVLEPVAGALSDLRVEDVLSAADAVAAAAARNEATLSTYVYELTNGDRVTVESWLDDSRRLATFVVTQSGTGVAKSAPRATAAQPAAGSAEPTSAPTPTQAVGADLAQRLGRLTERAEDRVFVLPSYKAANLGRPLKDYLDPPAKGG